MMASCQLEIMMNMGGCFQYWSIPYDMVLSEWANA